MRIARTNISDEVANWLTEAIEAGRFRPGDKLPSVAQLARELGVGRSSVREALSYHQALGLIEVHHGKGTFVASSQSVHLGSYMTSFSESVRERGMEPGAVVLDREVMVAPDMVQDNLDLSGDSNVNLLKRLRLADGEPMAMETSYTPYTLFPDLLTGERRLDHSLYEVLTEQYNVRLSYAQQTVGATLITQDQSQLLQMAVGSPTIEVHTVVYTVDNVPVEYGISVYRSDRYEYTVTLRRRN